MGVRFYSTSYFIRNDKNESHSSNNIKDCLKKAFPTLTSIYPKKCKYIFHCRQCVKLGGFITKITTRENKRRKKKPSRLCGQTLSKLINEIYLFIVEDIMKAMNNRNCGNCWCTFTDKMIDSDTYG